ncbi:DUF3857 domain-containing protein [Marinoscillum sp.]|uniref:DUF3857 domain-containing protein n=1 Tax=Marinoscillum sp. TaxID=2024838 RepID=UPI003BA8B8CE
MKLSFIISSLFLCNLGIAQGLLNDVPADLKTNANEVVLYDHTTFTIKDLNNSSLHRRYKAIIRNSRATDLKSVYLYYDDFRTIKSAQIKTYDLFEHEKEHIKLKDFGDYSTKGSSIADDSRAKYYEVTDDKYPYVVEVEYTIEYLGSMFYPSWYPQSDENQSVLQATLRVEGPENNPFRHKSVNITPEEYSQEGRLIFKWVVDSLKAFEYESYSYTIEDYAPVVYTAPNSFEMDGHVGNLSTWSDFGQWIRELNKDQNTLTFDQLSEIKKLIPEDASNLDKVKIAYKYLQDNTRYVSIQLGIGGWQPFESGFVHTSKYGDCKALSFYTQSILSGLGIKSYYTLINAGPYARELDPEFPNARFNHAILTVPFEKDTIWLECTSQTDPFGYQGTFTSNRNALMITEDDALIVKTKTYTPEDNLQITLANLSVKEDGSAEVDINRTYTGLEIGNNRFSSSVLTPPSEQTKWFYDRHKWGDLVLDSLNLSPASNQVIPTAQMKANLQLKKAAISNSNRLFYQPFVFTNINYMNFKTKERQKPVEIRYGYTQIDTLNVTFPEVYFPENTPQDIQLNTSFGSYERTIIQDQNQFKIIRKCVIQNGTYPPSSYESLREFIRGVQKLDREKIVMLNKT